MKSAADRARDAIIDACGCVEEFSPYDKIVWDCIEELEAAYSAQGNYKILYDSAMLLITMPGNEQAERIEELERERDTARQLAGTWRARAWASNPATSPFPWEPEHTGGGDE